MSDTRVQRTGDGAAVRVERHLADPPATVWQALTDRQQLRSWFPCDVEVAGGTWAAGAAITFVFPPEVIDLTLTGEVLVVDEPRALAFTWGEETLRFELSDEDGGTRLVLVDELPASAAARNAAGWEDCLDRLAGTRPEPGAWKRRFEAFSAAFEPEFGRQEGPPAVYKGDSAG
ncbi:MAG TPA: ATPase [Acidimicrobiaceae bacterium]|nr:ATPase [Acidimicrobiaceae bacterium]